jgi:hypothetical protein
LPALTATSAFVTTITSEMLLAAGASVIAAGVATHHYIESNKGVNVQSALPKYREETIPPKEIPSD